jgi:hypothetical protein
VASPQSLYFKGVAIVASHALPAAVPSFLEGDARRLAVLPVRELAFAGGEQSSPYEQYGSIAFSWLQARSRAPQATIDWDAFASSPAVYDATHPSLDVARVAAARAFLLFKDESFASLLSGTQAALSILRPDTTEDLLLDDLEDLHAAMGDLEAFYAQNGVPKAGIHEFIVNSYVFLRLNNGGRRLASLLGLLRTGSGYGRLDITTVPTPADVYVDGRSMAKSPTTLFVIPGSRAVEGKTTSQKAKQTVQVAANQIVPLKLTLA